MFLSNMYKWGQAIARPTWHCKDQGPPGNAGSDSWVLKFLPYFTDSGGKMDPNSKSWL